jgi:hypothetical protein
VLHGRDVPLEDMSNRIQIGLSLRSGSSYAKAIGSSFTVNENPRGILSARARS